jgi:hypothetical protein
VFPVEDSLSEKKAPVAPHDSAATKTIIPKLNNIFLFIFYKINKLNNTRIISCVFLFFIISFKKLISCAKNSKKDAVLIKNH